jgi:hypothetical protein
MVHGDLWADLGGRASQLDLLASQAVAVGSAGDQQARGDRKQSLPTRFHHRRINSTARRCPAAPSFGVCVDHRLADIDEAVLTGPR